MNGNTDIRDLMIQIEKARKRLVQPFLQNLGLTLGQGPVSYTHLTLPTTSRV